MGDEMLDCFARGVGFGIGLAVGLGVAYGVAGVAIAIFMGI